MKSPMYDLARSMGTLEETQHVVLNESRIAARPEGVRPSWEITGLKDDRIG